MNFEIKKLRELRHFYILCLQVSIYIIFTVNLFTISVCLQVHVYYSGRVKSSGKLFDSNVGSRPFKFRLGKSEVIKGWDVGLRGRLQHSLVCLVAYKLHWLHTHPLIPAN